MFRGVTTVSRVIPTHASPTIRSRRLLRGAVKIETFVVSSLNYRLTFISRDVVSIFLLLFFFVRKLEKASKKKNLLFFFFWPQIFSRLENEASTVTEIASVQILRTRHNRLAILYDIIGEKRMLLFRDRNQRAVSPSIAQRGIVDRLPRQQWNRAKRS